jgi:hypothetical protein
MRSTNVGPVCTPAGAFAAVALLVFAAFGAGCATLAPREVVPERLADEAELAGLPNIRVWGDAPAASLAALVRGERSGASAPPAARGPSTRPSPEFNIVAISGGGDNGAFGAGLLVGWSDARGCPAFC